jgi:preprotein translocase subunit YajC
VNELVSLLPIVGIALLFWFLIIRPQSKRQKALVALQSSLTVGSEVMLTSGIFGVVEALDDDRVTLRISDGVSVHVVRGAVANVVPPAEPETPPTTTEA